MKYDKQEFERFYEANKKLIYNAVYKFKGIPRFHDMEEDLIGEGTVAFVRAYKMFDENRGECKITTYIMSSVFYAIYHFLNKSKNKSENEFYANDKLCINSDGEFFDIMEDIKVMTEDEIVDNLMSNDFKKAFDNLFGKRDKQLKEIVELRYLKGVTSTDVAEMYDYTQSNISMMVNRFLDNRRRVFDIKPNDTYDDFKEKFYKGMDNERYWELNKRKGDSGEFKGYRIGEALKRNIDTVYGQTGCTDRYELCNLVVEYYIEIYGEHLYEFRLKQGNADTTKKLLKAIDYYLLKYVKKIIGRHKRDIQITSEKAVFGNI